MILTVSQPIGGSPSAEGFFEAYLAAPLIIVLYIFWKCYSWFKYPSHRPLYVKIKDIDIYTGLRPDQRRLSAIEVENARSKDRTPMAMVKNVLGGLF